MGFIAHKYPNPTDYLFGIDTVILEAERVNPNIKMKGNPARVEADKLIKKLNIFEVLFVNSNGYFTDGSRSNLFIIHENTIYTAPDKKVLKGVTRKYVMKVIEDNGINYKLKEFDFQKFDEIEAAFVCGTSPGVLPIKRINNRKLHVDNPIVKKIISGYNGLVSNYLSEI